MLASHSVVRYPHQERPITFPHNPSHSPVTPVASCTIVPPPAYPSLNIFQGLAPSSQATQSSPNCHRNLYPAPASQHLPPSWIDARCTNYPQLLPRYSIAGSRSNPSLSSRLFNLQISHRNLSDSSLRELPSTTTTRMMSSHKKSNNGCLPLTSPLAPPSLVETCVTAPPPSSTQSSRKKAKTRLHLSSLPQFPQLPLQSASQSPATAAMLSTASSYNYDPRAFVSAQQQLQFHQKDLIQQATRGSLPSHLLFPVSPRLIPCGSPGPVTPLTLEESSGYMTASSTSSSSLGSSLNMPFIPQMEMDKLSAIAAAQN